MTIIRLNLAEPIPLSAFEHPINAAILLSLFCDARDKNQRGWWGDELAADAYDRWGSRLWSVLKGKNTSETLRLTEDYAKEALSWMVRDGVANSINATAEAQKEILYLSIYIDRKKINLELQNAN